MDKKALCILGAILTFAGISIFFSCEKDDICADQVITPFFIIRMMDAEDPTTVDAVSDLQIEYIEENPDQDDDDTTDDAYIKQFVYDSATDTDSITLSLPVNKTVATYVFYQNYDIDLIENGVDENGDQIFEEVLNTNTEIDTITFTYAVNEEYVSRACGFRVTYSNLSVDIETSGDARSFIDSQNIITRIIEDEEQAHVQLRH